MSRSAESKAALAERQERLELRRKEVGIQIDRVTDVSSTDFPGHSADEDHAWDLETFKKGLFVQIVKLDKDMLEFDLVGVDASIANAIRRILIAEVPTMAIEYVYVMTNTSVVQDEVLSQRLGLVPLLMPIDSFKDFQRPKEGEQAAPTDEDTAVFDLRVRCTRNKDAPKGCEDPKVLYVNGDVTSGHIQFRPMGSQAEVLKDIDTLGPVNKDILLTKLRPGQEVDLELHAVRGIGQDHAKFSPVSPASYRMMPTITLLEPITGEDAHKFQKCFPKSVIKVKKDPTTGLDTAVVRHPRYDTVSRECLRHPEFKDKVRLGRKRDHFLFTVEGTGVYEVDELVIKSLQILRTKCRVIKQEIERLQGEGASNVAEEESNTEAEGADKMTGVETQ
ncbi:DNA-directed RNA polymerases I and III subunit RPAC1 [Protomyces lactucae-debilis]|uniref:DNA-directed RNA polymerases I and III subunit RPAC1 n=1 Tax=Protomyces lactucae-debilis TaxID=2754530 RepID=A0A1Y2F915_PROLT|nr:DNA-directed RNA polymerases I and III subunit RPAC1 [Protomyces lactucae-debilis]ORY80391.1 DNA-directed RNA polymerases I and III subunit RPAC1 [Protomyces lactucae-debilis]